MEHYIKAINEATTPYDLRDVVRRCGVRVRTPEITRTLFQRIEKLKDYTLSAVDRCSFEVLKEEVEEYLDEFNQFKCNRSGTLIDKADYLIGVFDASEETNLLARAERQLIYRAMADNHNNRARAAECLGIDRRTLRAKLRLYEGTVDSESNYGVRSPFKTGEASAEA